MEGCREGKWVEIPEGPLDLVVVEGEGDRSGASFPAGYESRLYGLRPSEEEEEGEDSEGEEGGPGPP